MSAVNPRRRYSSPLRTGRAQGTRRAVLTAARELFLERGYGATTVEEVAARAGVSKPTVFSAVGNKQELLRAVRDVAIAGDDEPIPVAQRTSATRIRESRTQEQAVALLADHLTGVARRYAPIHEVLRGAASTGQPELRELWAVEEQQRLTGARHWVEVLAAKGPVRDKLTMDEASDQLWLLMAPDNYLRLVHERGWQESAYRCWLEHCIQTLVCGRRPG